MVSDAPGSQPPVEYHCIDTQESILPTPNEHSQPKDSQCNHRPHTEESGSPKEDSQDNHRSETPESEPEDAESPSKDEHRGILSIDGLISILLLPFFVLHVFLTCLSPFLEDLYLHHLEPLYLDLLDVFDYINYLYENDSFLSGGSRSGDIPYFATWRTIEAAKERVLEVYEGWVTDWGENKGEPLILQGEDMMLLARCGFDIRDVLFDDIETCDEGEGEEDEREALREASRIAEGLGVEAVVFVWKKNRGEGEEGDEEGRWWILSANDWTEDAETIRRERMRENKEDLKREGWGWMGAVLVVVLSGLWWKWWPRYGGDVVKLWEWIWGNGLVWLERCRAWRRV